MCVHFFLTVWFELEIWVGGSHSGSLVCRLHTHRSFRISGSYQAASEVNMRDLLLASSSLAAQIVVCAWGHTLKSHLVLINYPTWRWQKMFLISKIQHGRDCFHPKNTTWGQLIRAAKRTKKKRRLCLWWKKKCVGRACANISRCGVQTLSTAPLCGYVYCTPVLALVFVSLHVKSLQASALAEILQPESDGCSYCFLYLPLWSCLCVTGQTRVHLQIILLASPKKECSSVLHLNISNAFLIIIIFFFRLLPFVPNSSREAETSSKCNWTFA